MTKRRRFIKLETHTTSIELEPLFWETIDQLAADTGCWQDWVKEKLRDKPRSVGRASYLRQAAHQAALGQDGKVMTELYRDDNSVITILREIIWEQDEEIKKLCRGIGAIKARSHALGHQRIHHMAEALLSTRRAYEDR